MPKVSNKENKTPYQLRREELGLSREKAEELLTGIPAERIERIESEKVIPHPDEVMEMAEKYKLPTLCNYYCSKQCDIGRKYVPEIKVKDLSQIVLEMLASLNSIAKERERLIEITVDGRIDENEIIDFIKIQKQLEQISITVETLQLWTEQTLKNGTINTEAYNKYLCEDT